MLLRKTAAILCIIVMGTFFLDEVSAQNRYIGGTFSYAGTGVEYVRDIDSRTFVSYRLRMDTSSMFWSRLSSPGISAAAVFNIVFAGFESRNGVPVSFYAGPGVSAGYGTDIIGPTGMFIGLMGRVGAECRFPRGISLSLSLSPMIGGHFRIMDGMVNMRLFKTGLNYGVMPEVGVRYNF